MNLNHMNNSKPLLTPINPTVKLSNSMNPKNDNDRKRVHALDKIINCRLAVGHLIWILHTRPDISYAGGEVSRYVQNPGLKHFVALKRIFRYLNRTEIYGLLF